MAYVIASACFDVKDGDCQTACPVQAIFDEADLPPHEAGLQAINAEIFGPDVTGWGSPGGTSPKFATDRDHPTVAGYAACSASVDAA